MKKGDQTLQGIANITFAFSAPNAIYGRLHKLTLMALTSDWFWNDLLGKETWYVLSGGPKYIATTMLTAHPENKTARGVLTLLERIQQDDGSFKLSYIGQVQARSREETVKEWIRRFANQTK